MGRRTHRQEKQTPTQALRLIGPGIPTPRRATGFRRPRSGGLKPARGWRPCRGRGLQPGRGPGALIGRAWISKRRGGGPPTGRRPGYRAHCGPTWAFLGPRTAPPWSEVRQNPPKEAGAATSSDLRHLRSACRQAPQLASERGLQARLVAEQNQRDDDLRRPG